MPLNLAPAFATAHAIRRFSLELGEVVAQAVQRNQFPLVIGGDCSILLGCLYGARANGPVGLTHIDGHSDFYHPGNYDTAARLGSAAGMELALATGRGEALLAEWDGQALVEDANVTQVGERDELDPDYDYRDIEKTRIRRFPVRKILRDGIAATVDEFLSVSNGPWQSWLHVDLDILDQAVMPAVDSPGSPGLNFSQLGDLISRLITSGRIIGLDVSIYDPEHDPTGRYARAIVDWLATALQPIGSSQGRAI